MSKPTSLPSRVFFSVEAEVGRLTEGVLMVPFVGLHPMLAPPLDNSLHVQTLEVLKKRDMELFQLALPSCRVSLMTAREL